MDIKPNKRSFPRFSITKEKVEAILKDIREGSTNKHAAEANGISERHFYYSILQGVCDLEHDKSNSVYAQLVQSLRQIEQSEIKECRKQIKENKKSHKGAEWTLEHVYWQHFSASAPIIEIDARLRDLEQGELNNEKETEEKTDANA